MKSWSLKSIAQHIATLRSEIFAHPDEWTYDLRRDLLHYAQLHDTMLEEYQALFRMFIGEAQRHPLEALEVLQRSFLPLREKLTDYLQACVERGKVRPDIPLPLAVDQLTGMFLAGMIRRHVLPVKPSYSRQQYVEQCIDLFVQGVSLSPTLQASICLKSHA